MVKFFKMRRLSLLLIKAIVFMLGVLLFFVIITSKASVNNGDEGVFKISNAYIHLEYNGERNYFTITNKRNKRVYMTMPQSSYKTVAVKIVSSTAMEITKEFKDEKISVVSDFLIQDNRIKCVMKAGKNDVLYNPIGFPGAIVGTENNQRFAIPYAEGIYIPAINKCEFGDFQLWGHKSTMPFVGMTDSKSGIMITSDSPADTSISFVKPKGEQFFNYCMQLLHYPEKSFFGYNRVFFVDLVCINGYNEMAQIFRNHLEMKQRKKASGENDYLISLKQKAKKNQNILKLIGGVDFWLGPDDMKSNRIIDELSANGVRKALVNFQYGWKVFDNEKRPQVVKYAVDHGMLASRYDNYSDIFDPKVEKVSKRYRTEGFKGKVIKDSKGDMLKAYTSYYRGNPVTTYRVNSEISLRDVDAYLSNDLKENKYMGRFIDVLASCSLYEDYSSDHPLTRRKDSKARQELLKKISLDYKMITGTEETAYWAIPYSHYSEGTMTIAPPIGAGDDWSTPVNDPGDLYTKYTVNPAVRIPLKSLVYHDCHVSGWYTGDSVSKVMEYWRTKDLLTILYGSMNLVFPKNYSFWQEKKKEFMWSIKMTAWVFGRVGYERMLKHEFLSPDGLIQQTTFSNKISIIVNFSNKAYRYGKHEISAGEFLFIEGGNVSSTKSIKRKVAL